MNEDEALATLAEAEAQPVAQTDTHAEANAALSDKLSAAVVADNTATATALDPGLLGSVGNNQAVSAGEPHPGHAIIDEILRALHVQNAGPWMRAKLEELRKTL